MARRDWVNSPDSFCYICGEAVVKKQQRNISDCVKNVYFTCLILNKIKYSNHAWTICGDLRVISILLGQGENRKYPCFLCEWHSRDWAKHWTKKLWPKRTSLVPANKNVLRESLVNPNKVLLPPLHLKLGLMKQFVKALVRERDCFKYLGEKFSGLPEAKLKEGVFVVPDFCRLMKDKTFESKMQDNEKEAWMPLETLCWSFWVTRKTPTSSGSFGKCWQSLKI